MTLLFELLAVAALILLNAFFVAAEYGLVTARRTRIVELDPTVAYPGHGEPVREPAERARELLEHHRRRLAKTYEALGDEPRTGYEVSLALFGDQLSPQQRRFAVAETLSHLERLVVLGQAARGSVDGALAYTAA